MFLYEYFFFNFIDTKRPCADGTKKNGGCEMQCVQFSVGYKCVCPEGTKLADDDYSCEGKTPPATPNECPGYYIKNLIVRFQ